MLLNTLLYIVFQQSKFQLKTMLVLKVCPTNLCTVSQLVNKLTLFPGNHNLFHHVLIQLGQQTSFISCSVLHTMLTPHQPVSGSFANQYKDIDENKSSYN
jgi:hypothetical protein